MEEGISCPRMGGCIHDSCPFGTITMARDASGPICHGLEAVNLQWGNMAFAARAGTCAIRCLALLQFLCLVSQNTYEVLGLDCVA